MSSVIRYRPELDGIRAIAVISVIIFHMNSLWLPGGYVGVDIFFVLSGFLITTITIREIADGQFSLKDFYSRRFKRILPPLYIVILVTLLIGLIFCTPRDFEYLKGSVIYILFFISNVFFYTQVDYFAPLAGEIPLLHTWSLSLEEQFYFVWPLLLLGLSRLKYKNRLILVVLSVILSVGAGEYFLRILGDRSLAYYSFPSRAGEMLVGALLAMLLSSRTFFDFVGAKLAGSCGAIGFILLTCSLFFLGRDKHFPGISSLLPSCGTFFLILSLGSDRESFLKSILSHPFLVYIGRLSYSLYLWHWPILAYMRYIYGKEKIPLHWLAIAIVLTFFASFFSFIFLEVKVRKMNLSFSRSLVFCVLAPTVTIFSVIKIPQFSSSLFFEDQAEVISYGGSEICHGKINESCVRGDLTKKPEVLVFGDSHAAHLNYFIDVLGKKNEWSAMVISSSACGPVFGFDTSILDASVRTSCSELLRYVADNYKKYSTIIVAARWDYQLGLDTKIKSDMDFLEKFSKTIRSLKEGGSKIYFISQVPLLERNPLRMARFARIGVSQEVEKMSTYEDANSTIKKIVEREAVGWIDISHLIKDIALNGVYLNGQSLYLDNNHLNKIGAFELGQAFYRKYKDLSGYISD